jgi:O-antigen/teichoic acid export membrane protein
MNADDEQEGAAPRGTAPGRGTVQILISRMFLLVSGFGVSIILARGLGPVDFGIYGVVMSVLVWFERVISAGIPGATATLLLRGDEPRAVVQRSARLLLTFVALPLFVAVWLLAPALSAYLGIPSGTTLIRIAAFNLPAMAAYFAYDGIFNGQRMFAAQSLLQIAQSAAKLAGIALLVLVGLSVTGAFVAHVAATLIAVLMVPMRFRLDHGRASGAVMRRMVRIAVPMGAYLVALSVLMNLSLWQLQAAPNQSATDVGFYVAGLNLTRIMMMVPSTVSGVLFASLAWAISSSRPELARKYFQEAVRFALIVTAPACVVLTMDASAVLELLYGEDYVAGGPILAALCVAFALVALLDVLFHGLMAHGRFALSAAILIALVPVLFALNSVLIPWAGAVGAAVASMIAMSLGAAAGGALAWRNLTAPLSLRTFARIGFACVVVGFACAQVSVGGGWLVAKMSGLAVFYLAILWVTGEISTKDLRPFAVWKAETRSD